MSAVLPARDDVPRPDPVAAHDPGETARLGMWIFIATEVLFFGGLLFAYLYGRTHWPQGFAAASRCTDVVLGTLNTAVLLTSSALVAVAVGASQHGLRRTVAWCLGLAAALGLAFGVVKGIEWHAEWHEHLFPGPAFAIPTAGAQLFFMLYWTMTALHALHLAIGIVLLAVFARGAALERDWANPVRVDTAALYWHFVDVVWIFLYPLLYLVGRSQ